MGDPWAVGRSMGCAVGRFVGRSVGIRGYVGRSVPKRWGGGRNLALFRHRAARLPPTHPSAMYHWSELNHTLNSYYPLATIHDYP